MICLDGTSNEPESGTTNVARTYAIAAKHAGQLVYYDPGVGTMGARGAVTRIGQTSTRVAGLVVGFGVKDNIQEAYDWLSAHYQRDDRIFVFGFSRGAYTARALTGMLRTVGLLRPGADNLTPYAIKLYTKRGPDDATPEQRHGVLPAARLFNDRFGNPDFPNPFNPHVHQVKFLGRLGHRQDDRRAQPQGPLRAGAVALDPQDPQRGGRPARHGAGREAPPLPGLPLRRRRPSAARRDGTSSSGSPACTATWAASTTTTGSPTSPGRG